MKTESALICPDCLEWSTAFLKMFGKGFTFTTSYQSDYKISVFLTSLHMCTVRTHNNRENGTCWMLTR